MTDVATKNWYIVHTYSGFEKKVAESLAERVKAYGLQNDIGEVLIPTEDVVEMRGGKKVVTAKRAEHAKHLFSAFLAFSAVRFSPPAKSRVPLASSGRKS